MATTTVSGSGSTVNNGGTILQAGNVPSSRNFQNFGVNETVLKRRENDIIESHYSGVGSAFRGSTSSLDGQITESASTGYCNVNINTHGFSVGDVFYVSGNDVSAYNTAHKVLEVTDSNNVKTNIRYTSNSTTAGSYSVKARDFATMTAGEYVAKILGTQIAGTADTFLASGAAYTSGRQPINFLESMKVAMLTGRSWTGGQDGPPNYTDTVSESTLDYTSAMGNDDAARPTDAVPGELTYRTGAATPTQDEYAARTN